MQITINPRDIEDVKRSLAKLSGDEAKKALSRGINSTLTGVRTDGVGILKDHYALTATEIRNSFKITKAAFKDPSGSISSKGTFIRLIKFGAKQTQKGVTVRVLKVSPRKLVKHAFFAKLGGTKQVYRRTYKTKDGKQSKMSGAIGRSGWVYNKKTGRFFPVAALPLKYRFPIKALYGPRIQDYLGDPGIIGTLQRMAGDRLTKNMAHEVNYLLSQAR